MMLGTVIARLEEPGIAEAVLIAAGDMALLSRLQEAAAAEGVHLAAYASRAVRHFLDHADEEDWLQLMGLMGRSEEAGLVALRAILHKAADHASAGCSGEGPQSSRSVLTE
ncbi:hypothetical protein [Marinimicrococcus flavescens]|uniref:DUF3572 family protein n=1 Tax=Marinimicrococcus flavescens TaxID=3031815 RepID=A0AAP3XS42_9PROT|nr:hypothetical protein [Marinimicrococcus flavescens]